MGLTADTYTFLFTDIVGSTALMQTMESSMVAAVAAHDVLLTRIFQARGGHVFKHTGDGYCVAFSSPVEALNTAIDAQRALSGHAWDLPQPLRVRMAIHAGTAFAQGDDYRGLSLSRASRLLSLAHGGQILFSEAAEVILRDCLPEHIGLLDLGSARLPGLERPERVFQALVPGLEQDFPQPRSLETLPHNLKEQLTSFIGRDRELGEVLTLCRTRRLVTVTGPGGCGKTRLALQAASHLLNEFADGVWVVELAGLTDPALIPAAVASELKVRQEGVQTLDDVLLAFLKPRRLLLVLDNCEHVVEASALFAHALLQNSPSVHILATSRERLNVGGEAVWLIPPLTPPAGRGPASLTALLNSDAASLFVERAASMQPGFALSDGNAQPVAQVCRRLEGLPLALELAAAWAGTLPVEQIALRLEDHFRLLSAGPRPIAERHRSLQAALDWSYDLLAGPERMLLCRLSVFAGGWTLEVAEGVCADAGADPFETLNLLHCLVDKSLVAREEQDGAARFRLLETLRAYSLDKLRAAPGEVDARERHASYFLTWAESAESHLNGAEQGEWLTRIERDHDNLRASLRYLSETDAERFQRLASALYPFWYARGYLTEGRNWLEEAVAKADETVSEVRAKAVNRAGVFAWAQGDLDIAWARMQTSLMISRALRDDARVARALGNLALVAGDRGDFEAAAALQSDCLEIYRRLNDQDGVAKVLHNLGVLAMRRGDDVTAMRHHQEGLALYRKIGHVSESASALQNLGAAAYRLGDIANATVYLRESLEGYSRIADSRESTTQNWLYMGYLAIAKHQHPLAVRLLCQYAALQTRQKLSESDAEIELKKKHLQVLHSHLTHEEFSALCNGDPQMTIEEALSFQNLWR